MGGRGRLLFKFEASVAYKMSSKTARVTREKSCLENKHTTTETDKENKRRKEGRKAVIEALGLKTLAIDLLGGLCGRLVVGELIFVEVIFATMAVYKGQEESVQRERRGSASI